MPLPIYLECQQKLSHLLLRAHSLKTSCQTSYRPGGAWRPGREESKPLNDRNRREVPRWTTRGRGRHRGGAGLRHHPGGEVPSEENPGLAETSAEKWRNGGKTWLEGFKWF